MSKQDKIYTVVPKDGSPARLVEAGSRAAVVHHVADHLFGISVSTQQELVEAMRAGVNVEKASSLASGGKPAAQEPAVEAAQEPAAA